jgi:hypothetical protein
MSHDDDECVRRVAEYLDSIEKDGTVTVFCPDCLRARRVKRVDISPMGGSTATRCPRCFTRGITLIILQPGETQNEAIRRMKAHVENLRMEVHHTLNILAGKETQHTIEEAQ